MAAKDGLQEDASARACCDSMDDEQPGPSGRFALIPDAVRIPPLPYLLGNRVEHLVVEEEGMASDLIHNSLGLDKVRDGATDAQLPCLVVVVSARMRLSIHACTKQRQLPGATAFRPSVASLHSSCPSMRSLLIRLLHTLPAAAQALVERLIWFGAVHHCTVPPLPTRDPGSVSADTMQRIHALRDKAMKRWGRSVSGGRGERERKGKR